MKYSIFLLMLLPLMVFSNTSNTTIFAKRLPNENYQQALNRIKAKLPQETLHLANTPFSQQVPIAAIDFNRVPAVVTHQELIEMFYTIRDSRFLHTETMPDFARRISWLYPDDGCFARAALARVILRRGKLEEPAKIFAFGDLVISTPFSMEGLARWWFHVAPVVSYMGSVYVLDPAMDFNGPLLVNDWFTKMGTDVQMKGVICSAKSYDPFDKCLEATKERSKGAYRDQLYFLDNEWDRVSELGFNPLEVLGIKPPWLS